MKKLNAKTEQILFAAAAAVLVVLAVVMVILLLRSHRGTAEDIAATPEREVTVTLGPNGLTIAGRPVTAETDAFSLNHASLTAEDCAALAALPALKTLSLTDCGLEDVSFLTSLPGVTTLYLSDNNITDLSPIAALTSLRTLYLDHNPVSDLSPLMGLHSLTTLSLKGVSLSEASMKSLKAALPGCSIFDDGALDSGKTLTLGGVSFTTEETALGLSGLGITDITTLSACQQLEWLDLSMNPLGSVATLKNLPKLSYVNLAYTGLDDTGMDILMGIRHLTQLDIRGDSAVTANKLDEFRESLPNCTVVHDELYYKTRINGTDYYSSATSLSLADMGLTDISGLAHFDKLETLDLARNRLSSVAALRGCTALRVLNLEDNRIAGLNGLYDLKALEELDLSGNEVTDVTLLSGCTALRRLDLSNNRLTYTDHLALCSALQWLDLRGNPDVTWEMVEYLHLILPACEILTDAPEPTPVPTPPPTTPPVQEPVQDPDPEPAGTPIPTLPPETETAETPQV